MSLGLDDFQYELPSELIAQRPAAKRDDSRLMVLDRRRREKHHARFADLSRWLPPNTLLVVNDVRVVPVRLLGRRPSGGAVEALILNPPTGEAPAGSYDLTCLTRPARGLTPGTELDFGPDLKATVVGLGERGERTLRLEFGRSPAEVLESGGHMPLPPYIKRKDATDRNLDRERYQTIYARHPGAVAAPTAGLHFTPETFADLARRGVEVAALTLYVGAGTFAPVRETDITRHRIHAERVVVPPETARAVNQAKASGRPITAVGTTVVRSLEHSAGSDGRVAPLDGPCELFIYPGFEFKVVDHLLTNFHLPGSTLLMLVAALAGRDWIIDAYREAVAARYRFFSYGDAMLIL